jgi:hypothetical protein
MNGFTGAMCPCFFTAVYAIMMNVITGVFSEKNAVAAIKAVRKVLFVREYTF